MAGSAERTILRSTCPHDCPSSCALEIDVVDGRIGSVRGSASNSYTAGVICGKVARYAERAHHPERLLRPLMRVGPKGSDRFEQVSWDVALDRIAEAFLGAETAFGCESVWPYYFAGTMGLVMRDGINRLRHAKRYSGMYASICTTLAWSGFIAGTGRLAGPDPREMSKADVVVIWGTNAVSTQVNVMTHAIAARKQRGAKIVVVDVYRNDTMKLADLALCVRPGTDGALACAVMHCLFRDGYADREYLNMYTDHPRELERHLTSRTPEWASEITGLPVEEIEAFADLVGRRPRTFFRLGYGFSRHRNGAHNMHAASCIAAVIGAWQYEGGGAFHNNGGIYGWNKTLIEGLDVRDPNVRMLDMSRIGQVLTGNPADLGGGPPVKAMLIQNMNPAQVAPEQRLVKAGLARDDLFVATHEQFMTATARLSDVILPATMFFEHDDIYQGGGHQYVSLGPKLLEPPGECRSNHEVIVEIARRVGAVHQGFELSACEIIERTLQASGRGSLAELAMAQQKDCQPDFETSHYLSGFAYGDKRFRFKPDWTAVPMSGGRDHGAAASVPALPDHWDVIDRATAERPFKLVTAPARNYLNSTFNEATTSRRLEGKPRLKIHPRDLAALSMSDGDMARVGNDRGEIEITVQAFDGIRRGVVVAESIPPNSDFAHGNGLNTLTSADRAAPFGGAVFHDTSVWIARKTPVPELDATRRPANG